MAEHVKTPANLAQMTKGVGRSPANDTMLALAPKHTAEIETSSTPNLQKGDTLINWVANYMIMNRIKT